MPPAVQAVVEQLIDGRSAHRMATPLSETDAGLTLVDAYAIQDTLWTELERQGERRIGWKVGFTSRAARETMKIDESVAGFLLQSGVYSNGAEMPLSRFANVRVEVEVAFRMRSPLIGPGVTADTALLAVEGGVAALEFPDFRFGDNARAVDVVADDAYANAVVLGSPVTQLRGLDLALEGVVYEQNAEIVATNTAAEVMGNPLNSLAWLANHLATRSLGLNAGDLVMSGSISKLLRPKAGDTIRARFTRLGSVGVTFV